MSDRMLTPRSRFIRLVLAPIALLLGLAVLVLIDPNALCLAPAVALALLLLTRRYPGERILTRLARTGVSRRARRLAKPLAHRALEVILARGGLLIACGLAVRPPPPCPTR